MNSNDPAPESSGGVVPTPTSPDKRKPTGAALAIWCMTAAFGAYFCMYGIRKPFTATTYVGQTAFGMDLKSALVMVQVIGYMLSKFIGIKVIAEMPPGRRVAGIAGLTSVALASLLGFALTPVPWSVGFLFVNGLMLGMVFGLVLGFLEGRRMTELLAAGLCTSFILADGVTKSVGSWLVGQGVPELWMPFTAGAIFMVPLAFFLWMLSRIPQPDDGDRAERQERILMTYDDRLRYFRHYAFGLVCIISAYLLITLIRSLRADFAPEIWAAMAYLTTPEIYTTSELWVALAILASAGLFSLYRNNRVALFHSLVACAVGLLLLPVSLMGIKSGWISPFWFMVLVGLGLYLPYVLVHTTVFERIMAVTPDRGNIGFLMYLADSMGYLGYVLLMFTKKHLPVSEDPFEFFARLCLIAGSLGIIAFVSALIYFKVKLRPSGT